MSRFKKHKALDAALHSKIVDPSHLVARVQEWRAQGKTIVTLNGSFDLLHAGHLEMIFQASCQADLLLMLLNTDRSIQEYKSPSRPIIALKYRLSMIAALEMVDYVSWFDETDPRRILAQIQPDVHVNGAEYGVNCIEADVVRECGGKLHIVDLVPGLSTSLIVKKIVDTCA